jgi:hypothetical protein
MTDPSARLPTFSLVSRKQQVQSIPQLPFLDDVPCSDQHENTHTRLYGSDAVATPSSSSSSQQWEAHFRGRHLKGVSQVDIHSPPEPLHAPGYPGGREIGPQHSLLLALAGTPSSTALSARAACVMCASTAAVLLPASPYCRRHRPARSSLLQAAEGLAGHPGAVATSAPASAHLMLDVTCVPHALSICVPSVPLLQHTCQHPRDLQSPA